VESVNLKFTGNDIEALIAALYRLPDTYWATQNATDRENFEDCLEALTDRRIIPLGDTPDTSPVWQELRGFMFQDEHPRSRMVNVLGVLYVIAFAPELAEPEYAAWAYGVYADILGTLDIELI